MCIRSPQQLQDRAQILLPVEGLGHSPLFFWPAQPRLHQHCIVLVWVTSGAPMHSHNRVTNLHHQWPQPLLLLLSAICALPCLIVVQASSKSAMGTMKDAKQALSTADPPPILVWTCAWKARFYATQLIHGASDKSPCSFANTDAQTA